MSTELSKTKFPPSHSQLLEFTHNLNDKMALVPDWQHSVREAWSGDKLNNMSSFNFNLFTGSNM